MRYAHILLVVASEIWAIDEHKLDQIVAFLALQASGEKLSAEELQARVTRQMERDVARREGTVAVLPLRGVIANRMNMMSEISGGTSSEGFGRMFDAAVADDGVKAVILGKLDAMEERMDKAETSRAGVHRRLDDLLQRTTHLEGEVSSTKAKVEDMEKVTVEVTTLRSKAQGAGTLGQWLIRAGIGVVTLAGWIIGVYTWITGRPPP